MYRCSGRKDVKGYCKQRVDCKGDYCRYHIDQKPHVTLCKCFLDTGNQCPYPAGTNGFCEFHIETTQCQGKTLIGGKCLRSIPSGKFCWNCKKQDSVIEDAVKTSAENMRGYIVKQHGPLFPHKKPATVPIAPINFTLDIPEGLKKIELAKPDDCCCCLEPMDGDYGTSYRKIGCGHYFHLDCISKVRKMECPMCRAPIQKAYLPKWVILRIEENIERAAHEELTEQQQATRRFIQEIVRDEYLDMNSSEEEDFNHHVNNGSPMALQTVTDNNGNARIALVVLGTTP